MICRTKRMGTRGIRQSASGKPTAHDDADLLSISCDGNAKDVTKFLVGSGRHTVKASPKAETTVC